MTLWKIITSPSIISMKCARFLCWHFVSSLTAFRFFLQLHFAYGSFAASKRRNNGTESAGVYFSVSSVSLSSVCIRLQRASLKSRRKPMMGSIRVSRAGYMHCLWLNQQHTWHSIFSRFVLCFLIHFHILRGDTASMLSHTYTLEPLKKFKVAICNHQGGCPFFIWGLMSEFAISEHRV